MILIIAIDVLVVTILVVIAAERGLEAALPAFVFMIVLLPVHSQLVIPGLFTLMSQRVALITLVVLYLFLGKRKGGTAPILGTPLKYLLLLHITWCLVSTVNSVVPLDSAKKMLKEVIEFYLMYYIFIKTITKVDTIHKVLGAMVLAVFVACILGSFEAYTGWRVAQLFPTISGRFVFEASDLGRGNRIGSTFANYSLFGAGISFAIIEAVYLMALARSRAQKIFLWIAVLVMFLNIYKTLSRGPWLALMIGFCLLFPFCQLETRKRLLIICALATAVFIIRPGVYDQVRNMYVGTIETNNPDNILATSYQYRYALTDVGIHALNKSRGRQLWGYGMESFYDLHLTAPFYNNPNHEFLSCDSSWIELMVETGYVGLFIIALLLATPALMIFRNIRKIPRPDNYLCWILLINMVQYFFMMTNLALYAWGQTGYMLWTWIALSIVYPTLRKREGQSLQSAKPQAISVGPQLIGVAGA